MVPGGRVFVWPVIQRVQRISLNTMTLSIESARVYTQQGVPISVTGIAQVKIQVNLYFLSNNEVFFRSPEDARCINDILFR